MRELIEGLAWRILGNRARPVGHIRQVRDLRTGECLRVSHNPVIRDGRGRLYTIKK